MRPESSLMFRFESERGRPDPAEWGAVPPHVGTLVGKMSAEREVPRRLAIPALCLRIPGTRLDLALQKGVEHGCHSRMAGIQISVQAHFDSKLPIWNTPLCRRSPEIRGEIMGAAAGEDVPKIE